MRVRLGPTVREGALSDARIAAGGIRDVLDILKKGKIDTDILSDLIDQLSSVEDIAHNLGVTLRVEMASWEKMAKAAGTSLDCHTTFENQTQKLPHNPQSVPLPNPPVCDTEAYKIEDQSLNSSMFHTGVKQHAEKVRLFVKNTRKLASLPLSLKDIEQLTECSSFEGSEAARPSLPYSDYTEPKFRSLESRSGSYFAVPAPKQRDPRSSSSLPSFSPLPFADSVSGHFRELIYTADKSIVQNAGGN